MLHSYKRCMNVLLANGYTIYSTVSYISCMTRPPLPGLPVSVCQCSRFNTMVLPPSLFVLTLWGLTVTNTGVDFNRTDCNNHC